ncbi:MAG: MarR family winged helix-turn-helix transcriptional regulator [Acidimicrobiales bacterium]
MPPPASALPPAHDPAALPPAHDPAALTWLLRHAVRRYRSTVAEALLSAGYGDLPQQGIWAVSALAQATPGVSGRDLVARMDISKQAVSQLMDTLVDGGFVARRPSTGDRRRTLLVLTPRGRRVARVIDRAVAGVEAAMAAAIGAERLGLLYGALQDLDRHETPAQVRRHRDEGKDPALEPARRAGRPGRSA